MNFKLGILICDHVNKLLSDEFKSYPAMFDDLLSHVEDDFEARYYFVIDNDFPVNINECDAYMTSGSQFGANDDLPWINKLVKFIADLYQANKVFIGICFGHQLIAKALGGKVEKSEKGWGIGIHSSQIVDRQTWMKENIETVDLIVSHQDQISQVPRDTKVLSSNDFCPFSMIQVGNNFIGLQGHPEFTHQYSDALMEVRRDRIPKDVITRGKSSLNCTTNSTEIMQSIINFLKRRLHKN